MQVPSPIQPPSFSLHRPLPIDAAMSEQVRLLSQYDRHFDVRVAENWADLEQCHRMRYQVYCIENSYEDPADNPDGLEIDRFDGHSAHVLLRHKASGLPIGAVRLILPWPGLPHCSLPIQRIGSNPLLLDAEHIPLAQTAEISRFCVSKEARRQLASRFTGEKELMVYVTLGLLQGLVRLSALHGIRHLCIVVEPALFRFLRRLGLHFEPLGPLVEYHGLRQPCHADVDQLMTQVAVVRPDVWSVLTQNGQLWPPSAKKDAPHRPHKMEMMAC